MKLGIEIVLGGVAAIVTYSLARPAQQSTVAPPQRMEVVEGAASGGGSATSPPTHEQDAGIRRGVVDTSAKHGTAPESAARTRAMQTLYNAVVMASAEDTFSRGEDIRQCLSGVELAGPQKLRFAVSVTSGPAQAVAGPWRFVEIVDGEPLPASFPECAERILGGAERVVKAGEDAFPDFVGELDIIYRIPAPALRQ